MPQSGKPAKIYDSYEENVEHRGDHSNSGEDHPREDIAASERFMPQAGKHTKTSSL